MTDVLKHRGPDGSGFWCHGNVALGHRRLAIIDLSENGTQPISNEDETIYLTFNGEIYNYRELRAWLTGEGHRFKSNTDSEVIVHLYEEMGVECVKKLRGMFALAIWDVRCHRLFLARDRIGIKPLFYHADKSRVRFGSEIKSILADESVERIVDKQGLRDFLTLNYVLAPRTLFSSVRQLPPAHCLALENDNVRIWRYWDIEYPERPAKRALRDWSDAFEGILSESVKSHTVSDVPFGVLLSGGVDSSTMVALMSEVYPQKVRSFSIGFKEDTYNELEYARLVAKRYDTDHMERIVEPQMADILEKVVWHSEEPLADPSSVPMYYLAETVSASVKMVLGGDGADELLAGYETYQADQYARLYRRIPRFLRKALIEPAINRLPVSYENFSLETKAKRFVKAADLPPNESHIAWRWIFSEDIRSQLQRDSEDTEPTFNTYREYFSRVQKSDLLSRMLYVDTCLHLPNDILTKVDRMSMAHGLEVRVPFLDHELVQFTAQVPATLKLRMYRHKKFLLKNAMKNRLPSPVLSRRKAGFNIPLGQWLRGDLRAMTCDLLAPDSVRKQGMFNEDVVEHIVDDHLKGRRDNGYQIWGLLVLMIWWRRFIG